MLSSQSIHLIGDYIKNLGNEKRGKTLSRVKTKRCDGSRLEKKVDGNQLRT